MKITRSNYEGWFLDFLEGNLDPSLKNEFQAFLKQNPDLKEELDMGDIIKLLTNKSVQFNGKEQLKKSASLSQNEFEERAIAYNEGDLLNKEKLNFEVLLANNPAKAAEVQKFAKLKLIADESIVFDNKNLIKRRGRVIPLFIKAVSVAAVLLLVFFLIKPNIRVHPEIGNQVADLKDQLPKNIDATSGKAKSEEIKTVKASPVNVPKLIPSTAPKKQKQIQEADKTDKKVIPVPHLRAPEAEPSLMKPRGIYFGQPNDIDLAVMTFNHSDLTPKEVALSELIKVQLVAIRKSEDRELLSSEHLGLFGLQLFAKLTGKRLTARKGDDGVVRSFNYNSRLLALSIPVNR